MTRNAALRLLVVAWGLTACASLQPLAKPRDALTVAEHMTLGNTYLAHNEKNLAIQQYRAALDQDRHDVPALMALGNIAFEERQWGQARSYFRRALKSAPNDAGASNNLAMVYLEEGKHLDIAQRLVNKALPKAGPLAPYLWDTRANIALSEGRYADAKSALDQAEAGAPANNPEFNKHLQESRQKLAEALKPRN